MTPLGDDYKNIPPDNRILLSDWYLIKSAKDHLGKRLAVGGDSTTRDHTLETFHSAPIVQRLCTFRLKTADGVIIMLNGIINSKRTRENGFPVEAIQKFQIGFPFAWETFADKYIERAATATSGGVHDPDVNEAQKNSAGRARRVKIELDDTKGRENIPFSNSGRSISDSCSYTKKLKAKTDALLVDVKLPVGSGITKFSLPLPCEATRKHTADKCLISSCGSARGSIPEFENGGMHPSDSKKSVKSDEMISQLPSDKVGDILVMGSQSTERAIQQNGLQDMSPKTKGFEANISENNDTNNIMASSSISVDDIGASTVKCVIENERHQTTFRSHIDIANECDSITMKVRGTKEQKIMPTKTQTRSRTAKPLMTTRRSSRRLASQRIPNHQTNHVQVANDSILVDDSNGKSPRDAPQMNFEGCNGRLSSILETKEHNENQSRRSLRKPVRKGVECSDSPAIILSKKDACMKSQASPASVAVTVFPPSATINHRIMKTSKESVCSRSKQEVEQKYRSPSEDGNIAQIADLKGKHLNDNPIEESVKESVEHHINPSKVILSHKEATDVSLPNAIKNAAVSAQCRPKITRSRAKIKLDSFQGINKGSNSCIMNGKSEGIISSISHSRDGSKLSLTERGPEETEDQMRSYSGSCSVKRCKLSNTWKGSDAKRKLHFDHSGNTSDSKYIDNTASPLSAKYARVDGQIDHNSKLRVDQTKTTRSRSCNVVVEKRESKRFGQRARSTGKSSSGSETVFKLKLSSSGRLVVPPLAYWRNEQVVYDKDGSITCISDGSKVIKRSKLSFLDP